MADRPRYKAKADGVVKWFNEKKGYGFVEHENGPDALVQRSRTRHPRQESVTFKIGDEVTYDIAKHPDGFAAVNLKLTDRKPTLQ